MCVTTKGQNNRARSSAAGIPGSVMNGSLELRITGREPFADGHPFEGTGPYERLVGRVHFAIEAAARRLVEERLMLEEDVERVVARAQDWGRPLHDVKL